MRNPLLDKDFLRTLDQQKEREIFARVVSLNFNEEPIEEITGRVTSGSVNIDGNSAVRRTCSLSLVAEEMNIHDYYWGMNTKFKLYIGMKNNIDSRYDNIIWFPQGTYLISTFNTSQNINNYTISIQGKDKMVLLNGEVGGTITALSQDFGTIDVQQANGEWVNESLLLKDVIKNAVHTFANEPFQNIIINDLEDCGVELMEYRGNLPLYFLINYESQEVFNSRLGAQSENNRTKDYYYKQYNHEKGEYPDEWSGFRISLEDDRIIYDNKIDYMEVANYPTLLMTYDTLGAEHIYTVMKITSGMTIGYRMTDLVYAGDLIMQVGGTITAMLDKIKNMLGQFEYFYDLDGHFIFQKKRTYLQNSWNGIQTNENSETYVDNLADSSAITYNFENSMLVTAFANNPNLGNLRNDFSIWGARKSQTGAEIPIHLRYAIDKKPQYYVTMDGATYTTKIPEEVEQDKIRFETDIGGGGYIKEPSRFGLNEDWWEVRDWAKAWDFSNLPIPTKNLGAYCPVRAIVYPEGEPPELSSAYDSYPRYPVPRETWESWGEMAAQQKYINTEDLIFHSDGTLWTWHGRCGHSYTEWLNYFRENGLYEGGYAYFYKPQVPADEIANNGGQGLILGDNIIYNMDWRELIYQMALDYMKYGNDDDFLIRLGSNNASFYPTGNTGYECYYTDLLGFWRTIYDPEYEHTFQRVYITRGDYDNVNNNEKYWTPVQCTSDTNYKDIATNKSRQFLQKIEYQNYNFVKFTKSKWEALTNKEEYYYLRPIEDRSKVEFNPAEVYYVEISNEFDPVTHWTKTVMNQSGGSPARPELLNFWFDFLDTTDGQMEKYSVHNVGSRPKAENDSGVKSIYYRDTPNVIVVNPKLIRKEEQSKLLAIYGSLDKWNEEISKDYNIPLNDKTSLEYRREVILDTMLDMRIAEIKALKPGYTIIRLNSTMENLFTISAQGKSAYDNLNNHLYNYAHCADTITITSLPIYYLNPNTRISVKDDNSGINGEYIINKITLPLQYSGTMSISATKAVESLF
jgi:hypothetical protein